MEMVMSGKVRYDTVGFLTFICQACIHPVSFLKTITYGSSSHYCPILDFVDFALFPFPSYLYAKLPSLARHKVKLKILLEVV
jgi:hypothetical protein